MLKNALIILFSILTINLQAQEADSLFAIHKGTVWMIRHVIQPGEHIPMLSRRYYVSEGAIAYANEVEQMKKLVPGDAINIPISKENFATAKTPLETYHELYYHVVPKDNIGLLATYSGVTKDEMRVWNNLHGYTLATGQALFIGWVKMVEKDTSSPTYTQAYPAIKKPSADSVKVMPIPGGLDTIYNRQTNGGSSALTEKGTAVFFEKAGKNNIYYAFHNATQRGAIIKIYNPGTGKTVYAKVLDKVPDTKQYANSIIGISNFAKEALGVTDSKAWVEISYSSN